MTYVTRFLREETGQDLVEYSLLIVFVLVATAVILQQTGVATVPVWAAASTTVGKAAIQAS